MTEVTSRYPALSNSVQITELEQDCHLPASIDALIGKDTKVFVQSKAATVTLTVSDLHGVSETVSDPECQE